MVRNLSDRCLLFNSVLLPTHLKCNFCTVFLPSYKILHNFKGVASNTAKLANIRNITIYLYSLNFRSVYYYLSNFPDFQIKELSPFNLLSKHITFGSL